MEQLDDKPVSAEEFYARINTYLTPREVESVREAYNFAAEAHAKQKRVSGEPYIIRPLGVAAILAQLQMDAATLSAAFLHDTVEDTEVTLEELTDIFGPEVAMLVDGVTKLGRIEYISREEQQVENYRKMFLAMAKDIRVVLIKLADRLHNMRTMKYMPDNKQKRISNETLEIYAPLAHRLGIYAIKWELEDLSFRYMDPQHYYQLVEQVKAKRHEREAWVQDELRKLCDESGIHYEIQGRPKSFYSIYKKMQRDHKSINEIYDLLAVRVLVDTVKDCYGVLGIVHGKWKPIPGRFKDYIAVPKSNGYQSLHTTVDSHWKFRSAPLKCIRCPNTVWRPIGGTRNPAAPKCPVRQIKAWTPKWRGCGSCWIGTRICGIPTSLWIRYGWMYFPMKSLSLRPRGTYWICPLAAFPLILPTGCIPAWAIAA